MAGRDRPASTTPEDGLGMISSLRARSGTSACTTRSSTSAASACWSRRPRRPSPGSMWAARHSSHLHGGPRGLHDALRLRPTPTNARSSRSSPRQRHRPPAGAGHPGGAHPGGRPRRGHHRRRQGVHHASRASAPRAPSGSCSNWPASWCPRASRPRPPAAPPTSPGRRRCSRRSWASAGPRRTPARPSTPPSRPNRTPSRTATSAEILRTVLRGLGRGSARAGR